MSDTESLLALHAKLDHLLERFASLEGKVAALANGALDRNTALDLTRQLYRGLDKQMGKRFLLAEDRDRDILGLLLAGRFATPKAQVVTDHPVAIHSDDHKFPLGTLNDNTRHPRFVRACERALGPNLKHLDLGCSGGGLVWDFLVSGHFSLGIEGSDLSRLEQRAEWRTIPNHLFTADITKPFSVLDTSGNAISFDVVTAWEVLEHIQEADLPALFDNIHRATKPGGLFVASVATFEDRDPVTGAVWHVTLKPKPWWHEQLNHAGFTIVDGLFQTSDYPRGSGAVRVGDWDARTNPELGFHVVCRRN